MMSHTPRIGIQIGTGDPFWVQVREVIWQRAQTLSVALIEVNLHDSEVPSLHKQVEFVEDLVVQELDALIGNALTPYLLTSIPDHGIPIIYLPESTLQHPRLTSHRGLFDAAYLVGTFLVKHLARFSTVLVIHGEIGEDEGGRSRLDGFSAALPAGQYDLHHVATNWTYADTQACVSAYLRAHPQLQIDAIFGLSDLLALTARDVCQALRRSHDGTLVLGINGDPLALAAITNGHMTATVETDVDDMAAQVVDLACRAARGEALPSHFQNLQRMVTAHNVAEVATRKLLSLANLPTRLVGTNRRNEQQRVTQFETSLAINQQVGHILDKHELSLAITALIRDNYGFDRAQFLFWYAELDRLVPIDPLPQTITDAGFVVDPRGPLAYVLAHNQTVFIPNVRSSHRFAPDLHWPDMQARVVVPVHFGSQIIGVLDLHHRRVAHHTPEELDGLQQLADQLGISMRNAELYGEALVARAIAEQADRLKTGLLANVSHELRTPLNVILGYSRTELDVLANGGTVPAEQLSQDFTRIYNSGEHLLRLINDLLDLSRAEIGELEVLPEVIDIRQFLEDLFRSSADHFGSDTVAWHLAIPVHLPSIKADPVRIRQVLLNVLHNASKFTKHGQITLGAEVVPPHLHMWVSDTGCGIPQELQEHIFEPFVSIDGMMRRREGIGLGLSITRQLVALHHGWMRVDSQPGIGSTFHIYVPLPRAHAEAAPLDTNAQSVLLLISDADAPRAELVQLAKQRGLALRHVRPDDDLKLVDTHLLALLMWDVEDTLADASRFVQQIRRHPQLRHIPILLHNPASDTMFTEASGVTTGLLLKPLSEHTLIEAVTTLSQPTSEGSILIVEDDPHTRALHRRLIAQHFPTYVIRDVGDGRAALEALAQELPSLLVLDLVMPEVDGFTVLEVLRTNARAATLPVLVLSGLALDPEHLRRLSEARVIFQTKNLLSDEELAESLRRTLVYDAALPPHTSAMVKQAIAFIQQHYNEPISRQEIAATIGVNKDYLGRIFHQELGISPWTYLIRYRVLRAKELLQTTSHTITEIATLVGFDTATYFSHVFHREVGCSPREFRVHPHP